MESSFVGERERRGFHLINISKLAFSSTKSRRGANDIKIVRAYKSASTNLLFNLYFYKLEVRTIWRIA